MAVWRGIAGVVRQQKGPISPLSVDNHPSRTARHFDKLDARRRTDAISRARDLGILP
jgi:hypothetical protein